MEAKAKIFISCPQDEHCDREKRIGEKIVEIISKYKFDFYLAIGKQDGRSIRENIFRELESSEYFLFIDLARDPFKDPKGEEKYRGSLFCHQELAIASYLGIEAAYFQEKVVSREGLLSYIQGNPFRFDGEKELLSAVEQLFTRENDRWTPNWSNKLKISLSKDKEPSFANLIVGSNNAVVLSSWYHLCVENLHNRKHACNCYVFLEAWRTAPSGDIITPRTIEMPWAGFAHPNATILPASHRNFDIFKMVEGQPDQLYTCSHSTSTQYHPATFLKGEYIVQYLLVSDNFPASRAAFKVIFDPSEEHFSKAKVTVSETDLIPLSKKEKIFNEDQLKRLTAANATTASNPWTFSSAV